MNGERVSPDTSTMEVLIDAMFIQVVDYLADIGTLLKEEYRRRVQAEERARAQTHHLQSARQLLEERALTISRLEATWREQAFARNVQTERADKLEMELASVDSTLDAIEADLGITRSEAGTSVGRRERLRALVIAMAASLDKSRATAVKSEANTPAADDTTSTATEGSGQA